jgi:hypothetical protein
MSAIRDLVNEYTRLTDFNISPTRKEESSIPKTSLLKLETSDVVQKLESHLSYYQKKYPLEQNIPDSIKKTVSDFAVPEYVVILLKGYEERLLDSMSEVMLD